MRFVDTSWWAAWAVPKERKHEQAREQSLREGSRSRWLTTNLVLGECFTLLNVKYGHKAAASFVDVLESQVENDNLAIARVSEEQEVAAWKWLRKHNERTYSFVDATSFRVMKDKRLVEALAFDGDFAAAGFVEVR